MSTTIKAASVMLLEKGFAKGPGYVVAPVDVGSAIHVHLILVVDKNKPGDRITQPSANGVRAGGSLGFARNFNSPVQIPLPAEMGRGTLICKGAYAVSSSVQDDWDRFGEDMDADKWMPYRTKQNKNTSVGEPKLL